nr:hypothetical protein [Phenylobacterium sp.]
MLLKPGADDVSRKEEGQDVARSVALIHLQPYASPLYPIEREDGVILGEELPSARHYDRAARAREDRGV